MTTATGLANPEARALGDRPWVDLARDPEFLESLATRDRWSYTHFVWAPRVIEEHLSRVVDLKDSSVLDFGCGEGLMAKGVAQLAKSVHGIELVRYYHKLEDRLAALFGHDHAVAPTNLRLVDPLRPLPYPDGTFDAVYAWSVFEHVADTPRALREIHRVLRPGGAFFLIINPLYYSAHGNHLWNVVDEPWVHLKVSKAELQERVRRAVMKTDVEDWQTDVYQGSPAEVYRNSLFVCLESLNGLTLSGLREGLHDVGFKIVHEETRESLPYEPSADLLERYSREDLMTDEVRLVLRR